MCRASCPSAGMLREAGVPGRGNLISATRSRYYEIYVISATWSALKYYNFTIWPNYCDLKRGNLFQRRSCISATGPSKVCMPKCLLSLCSCCWRVQLCKRDLVPARCWLGRVRAGHRLKGARGKGVQSAREMCGKCVGSGWEVYGKCLGNVWEVHGKC